MIKRLVDAVVHGFGFSAGSALFHDAAQKLAEETREPTEEEARAAKVRAEKLAAAEAKRQAAEAKKAEAARKKAAAEIDAELAALKKKLRK